MDRRHRLVQLSLLALISFSAFLAVEGSEKSGRHPEGLRGHSRQEDDDGLSRNGKSLANSFPFNQGSSNHHSHNHRNEYSQGRNEVVQARQAQGNDVSLDIGTIAAAGERCIDKVVMVEETEYDEVINCKHSYNERCHTTYKTDYQPQQEEECDENFRKNCYIEYKKVAFKEPVRMCFQPLVRNCNIPGPIECTTEYQTRCITRYHEHEVDDDVPNCVDDEEVKCEQVTQGYSSEEKCTKWPIKRCNLQRQRVKKYSPETNCEKVPFELCGPSSCPVEPGPEQCQDKEETIVQEVPEEICSLEPQRECKHVTKLVPLLKPAENCIDVPKEVCVRSRENPRRVQKPIVKKWCYTPTPESGLIETDSGSRSQGRVTPRPRPRPQPQPQPTPTGCAPGYPVDYCPSRAADGRCDRECNTRACGYDGGDCRPTRPPVTQAPPPPPPRGCLPGYPANYCPARAGDGQCHPECDTPACGYDGGDCRRPATTTSPPPRGCLPGYPYDYCPTRSGDGVCHSECNTAACGYDGGDCRPAPTTRPPPRGCLPGYPYDYCPTRSGDGVCHSECNTAACGYDGGDCRPAPTTRRPFTRRTTTQAPGCAPGYPRDHCPRRANNGRCDPECNNGACGFDGGDCKPPQSGYLPPPRQGYY